MDVTVDQVIDNIWNSKTDDEFLDVTLTLLKLIQNVLFNPDKPKFKKIKRNTTFFHANPGVEGFLAICGFQVRENWMVFMDTEIAFMKINTGKHKLLSYRKKVDSLKAYEVPENSLRYSSIMLGKGKFASVFQGSWENCSVAIKALHPHCSDQAVVDFSREAEILRSLKHNNIVILYAVCLQNINKRHAHVLELMGGAILDMLRTDPDLTTERLIAKALEVAAGLDHIHSKNILHCDIAARNILLSVQGVVKISDFGLARYADTPDCNLAGRTTVFPIRWTAPEVFTENILTKSSDVWSYGILCYEFITRGKTPYGTFQNRQIKRSVSTGYRLPKSEDCPQDFYTLMSKCWNSEPKNRPSFQAIYQDLINMKLGFAQKQKFSVSFDSADDTTPIRRTGRRSSMRASFRKLVKSVSIKRASIMTPEFEESLPVYTNLVQNSKEKVVFRCKKEAQTSEILKKVLLKLGLPGNHTYRYALVEVFDPRSGLARSQPALNASAESSTPYVKLRSLSEQPLLLKDLWQHKQHTRYLLCTRGSILRVLDLCRLVRDKISVEPQPYETRGYLLQSTGIVSGRISIMWTKVWVTLDGVSLALFEDEECEEVWDNVLTVKKAEVSEARHDAFLVTDTSSTQHTFQAEDRDDSHRWVEAINAAVLAGAPDSEKLAESRSLHSSKVLIITGGGGSSVNYGHKHVTLFKDELVFYHNGERISGALEHLSDIQPSDPPCSGNLMCKGIRLIFRGKSSGKAPSLEYSIYPTSHVDFSSWTTALQKVAKLLSLTDVIKNLDINELKSVAPLSGIWGCHDNK